MADIVDVEKTWDYDDPSSRLVTVAFELDEQKRAWRVRTRQFVRGTVVTNYFFPETKEALDQLLSRFRSELVD